MTPILPQWLATLLLAVVLIAATEASFRFTRSYFRKKPEARTSGDGTGLMLSAALALLGLLIGFTFSLASDRYDARRGWVNEEANAIGTAYLRARLAVGPDAATLPTLWADYGEKRLALPGAAADPPRERALLDEANALQPRIWAALRRETIAAPNDITATMVDATNTAFDVAASRQTAVEARLPPAVTWSVIVYAIVAATILGHALVSDSRRLLMSSVLLGLVALSIGLIVDLDRPTTGLVRVSQAPMERAMATIRAMQAADRAATATTGGTP